MKLIFTIFLTLVIFSQAQSQSQYQSDHLIFPDPANKIILVEQTKSENGKLQGQIIKVESAFHKKIQSELHSEYHQQMIRISQCARNFTENSEGPNLLYLSNQDGGFPRQGISIANVVNQYQEYPDLHFVDLMLDEPRVDAGDLSIYTHELGHIMMNLILQNYWNEFPNPTSPKQHVSMGVTDPLTAFYEGWGVHFQRMTFDYMTDYQNSFFDKFDSNRAFTMSWHSNLDEYLRLFKVMDNGYIYEKLIPQGINTDSLSVQKLILLEHTSPIFDNSKIKNAQQMLACEGVIASIFYHINSSKRLQNNYQNKAFYRPFLLEDLPADISPSSVISPLENVYLKSLWIWNSMEKEKSLDFPIIEYIKQWCLLFPDEQEEILKVFITITKGRTVSNELAAMTASMNYFGQVGNINKFRELIPTTTAVLKKIIKDVVDDINMIDKNVGPEIWITHSELQIRRTLWMPEPKADLSINLNAATYSEMSAFLSEKKCKDFMKLRKEKGYFNSLSEIQTEGFIFNK